VLTAILLIGHATLYGQRHKEKSSEPPASFVADDNSDGDDDYDGDGGADTEHR